MRDKELWLNGSGYADPTAYKAMKGVMEMSVKVGEIYTTKTDRDMGREVLILATDGRICTVLNVKEEGHELDDLHLFIGDREFHLNSRMMQYCFANRCENRTHVLTDDQFGYVMDKVSASLGIEFDDSEELECAKEVIKAKNDQVECLVKKIEKLTAENARLELDNGDLKERIEEIKNEPIFPDDYDPHEATVLKTERDLYKSLYENTLERLLTR